MVKPKCLIVDSPNERREVYSLLARISPARRLAFLRWACRSATLPNSIQRPQPARKTVELAERARWDTGADERLTLETYMDLWFLCDSYSFNLEIALDRLVEMARRAG